MAMPRAEAVQVRSTVAPPPPWSRPPRPAGIPTGFAERGLQPASGSASASRPAPFPAPAAPLAGRRLPAVERLLGRALREMRDRELYLDLGFVRLGDYASERLGLSLRTAQELIRVEESLERLPGAAAAFEACRLSAAHVRMLSRVATPETEALWVARARRLRVKEFRRLVAACLERGLADPVSREARKGPLPGPGGARANGDPPGTAPPGPLDMDADAEDTRVPMAIRSPVWLLRWWRDTVLLAGRLSGAPLPAASVLELVLAEAMDAVPGDGIQDGARLGQAGGARLMGRGPAGHVQEPVPARIPAAASRPSEGAAGRLGTTGSGAALHHAEGTPTEVEAVHSGAAPLQTHEASAATGAAAARPVAQMNRAQPAGAVAAGSSGCHEDGHHHHFDSRPPDARQLDQILRELMTARQRCEASLAEQLACARSAQTHLLEGYRSLEHYATDRLGLSPRQMYYLLALHRTLDRLTDLRRALLDGQLTLRQALLVGRVATRETAGSWIRRAKAVTLRRLEDEVGCWVLLREERPEVWELLRGEPLPEGIVLIPGHEPRLHASAQRGGAGCRDAGLHTPALRVETEGRQDGLHDSAPGPGVTGRDDAAVLPADANAGADDSEGPTIGSHRGDERAGADEPHALPPGPPIGARAFLAALRSSEAATPLPRRMATLRMRVEPGIHDLWRRTCRALRSECDGPLQEWEALALLLRRFWKVWDNTATRRQRRENPTLERDGWRCTAPGCRAVGTGKLHEHHIVFRSAGGHLTDPANLTTLCTAHHQHLLHRGHVRCRGEAPDDLRWEMGVAGGRPAFLIYDGDRVAEETALTPRAHAHMHAGAGTHTSERPLRQ